MSPVSEVLTSVLYPCAIPDTELHCAGGEKRELTLSVPVLRKVGNVCVAF